MATNIPPDLPSDPSVSYRPATRGAPGFLSADAMASTAPVDRNAPLPIETLAPHRNPPTAPLFPGRKPPAKLPERDKYPAPEPVTDAPDADDDGPELATDSGYERIDVIGEGGFGQVFRARQSNLERIVALKTISTRMLVDERDSEYGAQVFVQEALATAALEHPNILPIHDLVFDAEGLPAICTKYIVGETWERGMSGLTQDELLDEGTLSANLVILRDVAQAMAFAHSRGILHRDIKPEQVMIGSYGETLLMDWGLAIRYAAPVQDQTNEHSPVSLRIPDLSDGVNPAGTPMYMAPEQTETTCARLGPWTDVYQLGGCLLRILTGRRPHAADNAQASFFHAAEQPVEMPRDQRIAEDLLRLLRESLEADTTKRLGSAAEFRDRITDHLYGATRRREARELALAATRELKSARTASDYRIFASAIDKVDRAVALHPNQPEYTTIRAGAIAAYSVAAMRHGDLVLAEIQADRLPPSNYATHLHERIRRRRLMRRTTRAAALVLAVVVLGGGWLSSYWIGLEKARAEQSLQAALQQGRSSFELTQATLLEFRGAADAELSDTLELEEVDADRISFAMAGHLVGPVVRYFEEQKTSGWEPELVAVHADRMLSTADALRVLSRYDEGLRLADRAVRLIDGMATPDAVALCRGLQTRGKLHVSTGEADAGDADYSRALDLARKHTPDDAALIASIMREIGAVRALRGQFDESERWWNDAIALLDESNESHLEQVLWLRHSLISQYVEFSRHDEARAMLDDLLAARRELSGEDSPEMLDALRLTALAMSRAGDYDSAEQLLREALQAHQRVQGPAHSETALTANNLASVLVRQGNIDEALEVQKVALDIYLEVYGREHSRTASALSNLAAMQRRVGAHETAEATIREALEIRHNVLGADHPDIATSLNNLADILEDQGRTEEALELSTEVLRICRAAYGNEHRHTASALSNRAVYLDKLGRLDEARPLLREALRVRAIIDGEDSPRLATPLNNLAVNLMRGGEYEEAIEMMTRVRDLIAQRPGSDVRRVAGSAANIAKAYTSWSTELFEAGDSGAALEKASAALDILADVDDGGALGLGLVSLRAEIFIRAGQPDGALPLLDELDVGERDTTYLRELLTVDFTSPASAPAE